MSFKASISRREFTKWALSAPVATTFIPNCDQYYPSKHQEYYY